MLLPDNILPELTIYYNGALVLKELQSNDEQELLDIYRIVKEKYGMSFNICILSLDWLYLAKFAEMDEQGVIKLCS